MSASDLLARADPELWDAISLENRRQEDHVELIASENYVSPAVLAAQGSQLTNKYAEGYPGRRYYGGCEFVDVVEDLARNRAKELFGAEYANVQPHSGSQANTAVYLAALDPGDTVLGLNLAHGGHLTHGMHLNISGILYHFVPYSVRKDDHRIDFDELAKLAKEHKPKLIVAGASAYPREIPHARFAQIAADVGAKLMVDMAHYAGLVAAGLHDNPVPVADYITSTTHKTLRGPRGGLILTNDEEMSKQINRAVFPGCQGGPLMHVIAGKAVCFGEALRPEFKTYAKQVVANAAELAKALIERKYHLASRGTDNHLVLIDLRPTLPDISGKQAATWLEEAGIVTNMNTVPDEQRSPMQTSGVRLGTPALTTRGLKEQQVRVVAELIDKALQSGGDSATLRDVRAQVQDICKQFPLAH